MGYHKRQLCKPRKSRRARAKAWLQKGKDVHVEVAESRDEDQLPSTSYDATMEEAVVEEMEVVQEETDTIPIIRSSEITGRRLVDIQYYTRAILDFPHHSLFSCSGTHVSMTHESRKGMFSTITLTCSMCQVKSIVSTDNPNSEVDANLATVTGIVSVGLGYANLNELCSAVNMPTMSKTLYQKTEGALATTFTDAALKSVIEAGKEEERLARKCGDVDPVDNKAFITVIADCAWSRRSNKSVFNANSGVASVIGEKTGKILFLGVKNKYCCVCAAHENDVPTHVCYKNHNGSSTSMESAIVIDAFLRSVEMHNLKYKYLIADGDSDTRPYGPEFLVEKIECKNHLLRNYCNRLKDLSSKRFSSNGNIVPARLRTLLKNNIRRLE